VLFNSITFPVFLVVVLLVYYRLKHRSQNLFLLASSYVFYGWWDWRFLFLLVLSTVVDFFCAKAIESGKTNGRRYLAVSVVTNLSILGLFKYFNFFAESATEALLSLGFRADFPTLHVILPVGISFYTFQSLSYTIDVYRGNARASRDLIDVALYVAFFPQLVAGPIERASRFLPQVQQKRVMRESRCLNGLWLIAMGYVKKLVIADHCAGIVDECFAGDSLALEGVSGWLVLYAFACQIYGDFSGYSDIARGTANLLGFRLMRNFGRPYLVADPSSFWRHWHISLSTWLRDYLYIPLGGNRQSEWKTNRNLMTTMALGGLWHGAGWAYLFWGIFHGALLICFRQFRKVRGRSGGTRGSSSWNGLKVLAFFHVTCIGWLLFRAGALPKEIAQAEFLQKSLQSLVHFGSDSPWPLARAILPAVCLTIFFQYYCARMECFSRWKTSSQAVGVAIATGLILALGVFEGTGFIYFQF